MIYLSIIAILILAYAIQYFDDKIDAKQNATIEEMHKDAYEWIDANTSNPAVARERKAEIDMMIKNVVESQGREYRPPTLKQVTTKKEREERNEAVLNGKRYVSGDLRFAAVAYATHGKPTAEEMWEYTEHTQDEKREHYIGCLMNNLGIPRAEAERRADSFYKQIKEN